MNNRMFRLLLAFGLMGSLGAQGQILHPAEWTKSISSENLSTGDEIELIFRAAIDSEWYMYSSEFDCEDGPIKAAFTFQPHPSYALMGDIIAVGAIDKHDEIFECDVRVFKGTGEFRQRIKVLRADLSITGNYEYQVCSDITGQCIPLDEDFVFSKVSVSGANVTFQNNNAPIIPDTDETSSTQFDEQVVYSGANSGPILDASILEGDSGYNDQSFLTYMVFAFLLGLTSLITPCVFPMIPMTVTFFLKGNQSKQQGVRSGIIFGISIIAIYTLAGSLFAVILGAEGLNALATHWIPNVFVFAVFIVFALSFLGLFEITAPHKLVNKMDQKAEKGGLAGIFFMAATLVLVSFSCTIPIVGNVIVLAAGGEITKPVMAMFFYSLAFAIPFALFAIFPEWLKSLPKSGGWLNSVKVTLGFLELALAFKFFSIADQAYHWGLLDRDLNIAIWIVIFSLLGFYFLGKIKLVHDTLSETISVPRLLLAVGVFSFVIYLIPGLWGAPLKGLAGYLPPMYTHDFDLVGMNNPKSGTICEDPKYAEFLHMPHGLQGYFDYDQALACARSQEKPLFIDFTGHGCTNCREMEAVVWSDPLVLERLRNDFVMVALYVDDKTELPESDWYTSSYDDKIKRTIGKQNADLQITNLENNAQPFYVLVGEDERVLAWPYAYDKDVENFVHFLDSGKEKYEELYTP